MIEPMELTCIEGRAPGRPKPARGIRRMPVPSGDRPAYPLDEGLT